MALVASTIPIGELTGVVLGLNRAYARGQAMAELAASDRPDKETLLARVLEDPRDQAPYHAAAAIALGRIATAASVQALVRNLPRADENTLREILRSLG